MGKKSKKGKKVKKTATVPSTFSEAMLAYRINVIEKKMEDLAFEVKGWQEKNNRAREHILKLKEEKEAVTSHMLNTYYKTKDSNKTSACSRDDVVATMKDVWDLKKQKQKELNEFEVKLKEKDDDIEKVSDEINYWNKYKQTQMVADSLEVKLLEQELQDLDVTFSEMTEFMKSNSERAKEIIQTDANELLGKQKDLALDNAMSQLSKYNIQEFKDNEWLKKEVGIQKSEHDNLEDVVNELERENMAVMSRLLDCRIDDLTIYRNVFMTQIEENENLEQEAITIMDMKNIMSGVDMLSYKKDMIKQFRPMSKTLQDFEDRVLPLLLADEAYSEDGSESNDASSLESSDFLKLGPMEVNVLHVSGKEARLHPYNECEDKDDELSTLNSSIIHKAIWTNQSDHVICIK